MRDALLLLAEATEPGDAAQAALAQLRERWADLTAEDRAALTPLAQLLAERLAAAAEPAAPPPPVRAERPAATAATRWS
jgi:ATP-dependent DNA helicase RecQ